MLRRNGPVVKSVESVLTLEGGRRWLKAKFHYAIWSQTGSKLMLVRC